MLLLLLSRFSRVRLCDPIDGSPPGSPVPGILQARTELWLINVDVWQKSNQYCKAIICQSKINKYFKKKLSLSALMYILPASFINFRMSCA